MTRYIRTIFSCLNDTTSIALRKRGFVEFGTDRNPLLCSMLLALFFIPLNARTSSAQEVGMGEQVINAIANKEIEEALQTFGELADRPMTRDQALKARLPAAAAAIHRALMQISSDERYERLREWTLPAKDRQTVRCLSTPVPVNAPPKAFARQVGQRPKDDTFPVADIAGAKGLFSSGWMLVQAADDVGRLNGLLLELKKLNDQRIDGAETMLQLAIAKSSRADTKSLADWLHKYAESRDEDAGVNGLSPKDFNAVAVACAASERSSVAEAATAMLLRLAAADGPDRSMLRIANAAATQNQLGESPPSVLFNHRFKHWVSTTGGPPTAMDHGQPMPMWLTHEGHLLHVAGGHEDALLLRYPLTGDFDFICETQEGGTVGTDGGVVYGGQHFEAIGRFDSLRVMDPIGNVTTKLQCPFVRHEKTPTFNRMSIRSVEGKTAMETNFHPMWTFDESAQTSPWLGLRSQGPKRPVFRNLKCNGTPSIPRQVELIDKSSVSGWTGTMKYKVDSSVLSSNGPGVLRYQRPLLDGETVEYQFRAKPGNITIHPVIGRLTFLLESSGVKVRWLTDHAFDWTGLKSDNALLEPLSRRGSRPLPVTEGWNDVAISRSGQFLDVTLNEELIYHRKIDFRDDFRFGLFRDTTGDDQIRNAVLKGDWPETLPEDFIDSPFALSTDTTVAISRPAHATLVGERLVASNVMEVRRSLAMKEDAFRYSKLREWVLPSSNDSDFRLSGYFAPSHASPNQLSDTAFSNWTADAEKGGASNLATFFSPADDLVDCATRLGKLDDLRTYVNEIDAGNDRSRKWYQKAFRLMIACKQGDSKSIEAGLVDLSKSVTNAIPIGSEYVVAWSSAKAIGDSLGVLGYVVDAYRRQVETQDTRTKLGFKTQFKSLLGKLQIRHPADSADAISTIELPAGMVIGEESNAITQSQGRPTSTWGSSSNGQTRFLSGHEFNHLYFPSPLIGNYTVESDIGLYASTSIHHLGLIAQLATDKLGLSTIGGPVSTKPITPVLERSKTWLRYRQDVRDGVSRIYLNGRLLQTRALDHRVEPWLSIRGWWKGSARFRDLSVSGDARIPDEVPMSAFGDLIGWTTYFGKSFQPESDGWKMDNSVGNQVITGARSQVRPGASLERLLQYHRPLAEDGHVEFEFLHEPGQMTVAPALGRLAFVLSRDAVVQHWVSDGRFERTNFRPGVGEMVSAYQRHDGQLPLRDGKWNQMRVSINEQQVALTLNGTLVYECPLPKESTRKFGLLYFADQSALQVRNVVMQGHWPKELNESTRQGNAIIAALNRHRDALPVKIDLALNRNEVVDQFLPDTQNSRAGAVSVGPAGRNMRVVSGGQWAQKSLASPVSIRGDFDVEATFENFQAPSDGKSSSARMTIALNDELESTCNIAIGNHAGTPSVLRGGINQKARDGTPIYQTERVPDESTSGRLRLVRRGTQSYALFAQSDSPVYRLLSRFKVSEADVLLNQLQLTLVNNGRGESQVTWTRFKLNADTVLRDNSKVSRIRQISVLDLQTDTQQKVARGSTMLPSVGSPVWSPDGKLIAYDQNTYSTRDSRILIVDSRGGEPKDIGFGSLPNFSPNGQQIAFSAAGQGVGVCDVDGTNRRILDRSGWGIEWSPKSNFLCYSRGNDLYLWNLRTDKASRLWSEDAAVRYSHLYWSIKWSHDARKIVFMGNRRDGSGQEVAYVSLDSPNDIKVLGSGVDVIVHFSWSRDDRFVLIANKPNDQKPVSLVKLAIEGGVATPWPIAVFKQDGKLFGAAWSPDQSKLALTLLPPNELISVQSVSNISETP